MDLRYELAYYALAYETRAPQPVYFNWYTKNQSLNL